MENIAVRSIRADEWREVRELRLRALQGEVAGIAFLDTFESAATHSDDFWIQRAAAASSDAGTDGRARQFVAARPDGVWVGTATVLVELAGEQDFQGNEIRRSGGAIVGVYVEPASRGQRVIDRLFDAALDWVKKRGLDAVRLTVHADNHRAQKAYGRSGFRPTGVVLASSIGPELEMARSV